jgi:hypothetical protein
MGVPETVGTMELRRIGLMVVDPAANDRAGEDAGRAKDRTTPNGEVTVVVVVVAVSGLTGAQESAKNDVLHRVCRTGDLSMTLAIDG